MNSIGTITGSVETIESLNKNLAEHHQQPFFLLQRKRIVCSFLGILVARATYNFILWTIIAGLLLFLLFFIYKSEICNFLPKAKSLLQKCGNRYEDTDEELWKEQKISSSLQDGDQ